MVSTFHSELSATGLTNYIVFIRSPCETISSGEITSCEKVFKISLDFFTERPQHKVKY